MTHCTHCHRPMIHPSPDGLGPKCRARLVVEQDGPDLFGYDIEKAVQAARYRLSVFIGTATVDAHIAVRRGFRLAREKLRAKAVVAEKRQDRAKREAMKTVPELIAEAQTAFNEFIRLRDRHKGCFVCGCAFPVGQLGGDFDAGHIRSRGAAGHLRFNEDNCHGECKPCNSSTGAKPHQIEAGAIRRIGQERYDALKNDNTPHKWARDELRAIRDQYKAKAKALKREAAL